MSIGNWVRGWKHSQAPKTAPRPRLGMEMLESRVVPATRTWDNGGATFNWSEAANWDNNIAPVNGDTVILPSAFNYFQDINGLILEQLQFTNGSGSATLTLNTPLGISGSSPSQDIVNGGNGINTITGSTLNLSNGFVNFAVNGGELTIRSAIAGTAIRKSGFNRLILDGSNSIGGGVVINQGSLRVVGEQAQNRFPANAQVIVDTGAFLEVASTNAIPTTGDAIDLTLNGGNLQITGATTNHVHIRNITFNGDNTNGGGSIRTSGAVGSFNNTNLAVGGDITVNGSSFSPATFDLANGFSIEGNRTINVSNISGNANADLLITATTVVRTGSISGLTKTGAGTMVIASASAYTGATTISAGTLQIGNAGATGSINSNAITNNGTLIFNRTGDYTVDSAISGSGSLTTLQAGTKTFTGNISQGGSITSTDGRLLLNGTVSNGAAAFDVTTSGSGAIGGTGTILGRTVITNGGSLFPGAFNTHGTLNVSDVTFAPGSSFGLNLNGPNSNDRINVTGQVVINSQVSIFAIEVPTATGTIMIINNDGTDPILGTFDGLPEGATLVGNNGKPFRISYTGGDGNDMILTTTLLPGPLLVTGPGTGAGTIFTAISGAYSGTTGVSLMPGFGGELRVALADVTGDGTLDRIVGSGPGGSRVRVLNGSDGSVLADFTAFPGFGGGIYVAAGDLNGDGRAEVVVTGDGADAFSGPVPNGLQVRVYSGVNLTGGTSNPPVYADFNGLASLSGAQGEGAAVRLGGRPAVADVNRDGLPDLLVSAGNGGGPRVVIWPGQAFLSSSSGQPPVNPLANLFVFESTQRGGAFLTAGDINGDGFADIAVGGGPGGGPRVRTVNAQLMLGLPNLEAVNLDDPANLSNGLVLNNFFAGDGNSRGGVRVAMRDVDTDGRGDLVTGSGTFEQSAIRVYSDAALAAAFGSSNEPSGPQIIDPFGVVLAGGVWIG